jgi:Tfp pilus assembly protein PilZ
VPLPVTLERRGAAPATVYATNLSPSGVCLHLHLTTRLAPGDAVLLHLALPEEPGPVTVRGRVSWCEDPARPLRARFVETGVRFEVLAEPDRERIARFVRSCDPRPA